jgi:hypothetical protein
MQEVLLGVLRLCHEAGLVRLGLVALDGTKVGANASLEANQTAGRIAQDVKRRLAEAEATDAREARQQAKIEVGVAEEQATGKRKRGRKPKPADPTIDPDTHANVTDPDSGIMKTRRGWLQGYNAQIVVTTGPIILAAAVTTEANDVRQLVPMLDAAQANVAAVVGQQAMLGAAVADAGCWSEANAASETQACELFIATRKDHKQRAALGDAPPPRGRIPKSMSRRDRMQRKLRTRRGRARYRRRGASVEPVFGQIKDRQGARRFSTRSLERCRGEWLLDAAVHTQRKLHSDSACRSERAGKKIVKGAHKAA